MNPDAIRTALHGQAYLQDAEDMVWTLAKYMVKSLHLAGHDEVVVDATNYSRKRRDFWSGKWKIRFIHIDTDKDTCIERAIEDGRSELIPIIQHMAANFEPLEEDEHF